MRMSRWYQPEEVAGFSCEVALVKRLTYIVECVGYPLPGFRNYLLFSSVSQRVLPSQLLAAQLVQLRRKFSLHRPFKGGC